MRSSIKIASIVGVIGVIALIAISGAVTAFGSMGDSSMKGPMNHMCGMASRGKENGIMGSEGGRAQELAPSVMTVT